METKSLKNIVKVLLLTFFCSCSMFFAKPIDNSPKYFLGQDTEKLSYSELKSKLERKTNMNGGEYKVKAFPLTKELMNKELQAQSSINYFSSEDLRKLTEKKVKKYLTSKTCFHIHFQAKRFEETKKTTNWQVKLVDHNNSPYPLKWILEDVNKSTPTASKPGFRGREKTWQGSGVTCTSAEVDLTKGFKLIVKAPKVQWPFSQTEPIEWLIHHYKKNENGEIVVEEQKPSSYKRYRGY